MRCTVGIVFKLNLAVSGSGVRCQANKNFKAMDNKSQINHNDQIQNPKQLASDPPHADFDIVILILFEDHDACNLLFPISRVRFFNPER